MPNNSTPPWVDVGGGDGSMESRFGESSVVGKSVVMIISIVIALLGNFFILFTFCRNFKMRTTTNTLVVNLCLSDLLSALVDSPFWFSILTGQLIYEQPLLCRILLSFEDLFQVAALLNMCTISLDRFLVLVKGLRRKMSRSRVKLAIAWCWFQAFVFAIPWSLFSDTEARRCRNFPHFYEPGIEPRVINIMFKVVCVFLPLFIVYYIFYRILKAAKSNRKVNIESSYISRNSSAEKFAVDAHKRSSKTAIILFLMFTLCTLPYLGINIWSMVERKQPDDFNTGFIIYFVFSLKRSLFPAIYIFRNRVIVSYLNETIKCSVCGQSTKSQPRNTFSYVPSQSNNNPVDTGPSFVLFGRRSFRSRIHPSVYDGDNQHFPKNLDVYFCNLKEQSKSDQFSDIAMEEQLQQQPSGVKENAV